MIETFDQLIRKEVLPIAERNGYYLDPERILSGWWEFEKEVRRKVSFYIVYRPTNRIGLYFHVDARKKTMPDIDDEWWSTHKPIRALDGWWSFRSQEELEEILQLFVIALLEKGIPMLEQRAQEIIEPDGLLEPTKEANYKLYQNHQKYQDLFFAQHSVKRTDYLSVLEILQLEANGWKRTDEDAEEKLIMIAAVFCSAFDSVNATWTWNEKLETAQLVIPTAWKGVSHYPPLIQIYSIVQCGNRKTLLKEFMGELSLNGYREKSCK